MARGSKAKYTSKQKRMARHIEKGYEKRGVSEKESEKRAWAMVNKEFGHAGTNKISNKEPSKKGGHKGGLSASHKKHHSKSAHTKSAHHKSASHKGAKHSARGSSAKATTDRDKIIRWVEDRDGMPAVVRATHGKDGGGLLRVNFPGYSGEDTLEEISWDEFFDTFDKNHLAFLYQNKTKSGRKSRFFKFIEGGRK
jgi:hypothetical protein